MPQLSLVNHKKVSEEKIIEYIGIIVPSTPYLTGLFNLRILLNKEPKALPPIAWSDDRDNLISRLAQQVLENPLEQNPEIHIIESDKSVQDLFEVSEDHRLSREKVHQYLTQVLNSDKYILSINLMNVMTSKNSLSPDTSSILEALLSKHRNFKNLENIKNEAKSVEEKQHLQTSSLESVTATPLSTQEVSKHEEVLEKPKWSPR